MKILVKEIDIKRGKPRLSGQCPIARAIRRQTGATRVNAYHAGAFVKGLCYWFPKKCGNFIRKFDNELPVRPFSFFIPYEN